MPSRANGGGPTIICDERVFPCLAHWLHIGRGWPCYRSQGNPGIQFRYSITRTTAHSDENSGGAANEVLETCSPNVSLLCSHLHRYSTVAPRLIRSDGLDEFQSGFHVDLPIWAKAFRVSTSTLLPSRMSEAAALCGRRMKRTLAKFCRLQADVCRFRHKCVELARPTQVNYSETCPGSDVQQL